MATEGMFQNLPYQNKKEYLDTLLDSLEKIYFRAFGIELAMSVRLVGALDNSRKGFPIL